jgi:L-asparagine transporter-like permease
MDAARLHPFTPHGWQPVASGVIVLFFAFTGWEVVIDGRVVVNPPPGQVVAAIRGQ